MAAILRSTRRFQLGAVRGLSTSTVRSHVAPLAVSASSAFPSPSPSPSAASPLALETLGSSTLLASSPLFLTDLKVPTYWTEIQFVLAGPINTLMESFFEVEGGPLFLNAMVMATLLKMATYYGFMQPSYLWHFQERYGQQWTVGHHLYGCSEPNPLKKGQ
mmetsp:Transcript_52832/g.115499  ORF Transcript_52832/g.115499 Transcript_52832/m.115499 type:complete len:161 (-) Transcript_52832:131-613(-)